MKLVRDILKEWLADHGYDGLCTQECGCFIEDLIPCQNDPSLCEPGKSKAEGGVYIIVPEEAIKKACKP